MAWTPPTDLFKPKLTENEQMVLHVLSKHPAVSAAGVTSDVMKVVEGYSKLDYDVIVSALNSLQEQNIVLYDFITDEACVLSWLNENFGKAGSKATTPNAVFGAVCAVNSEPIRDHLFFFLSNNEADVLHPPQIIRRNT